MRVGLQIVAASVLALILGAAAAQAADDDTAKQGASLYGQFCAQCHGQDMEDPVNGAFDLRKFPHDDAARFTASATNGKGDVMPAWGGMLAPEEIAAIWAYVRTGGN
jgi:mono/diheme cytochrome c family protein